MNTDCQPPDCQRLRDSASDYLDGHVTDHDRRRVEAHLNVCSECAEFVEDFQRTVGLLAELREAAPSEIQESQAARYFDEYFPEPDVPDELEDWTTVKRLWGELAQLGEYERRLAIEEDPRYLDARLCDWLIIRARRVSSVDPSRARLIAETAVVVGRRRNSTLGDSRRLIQALESLAWCLVVLREFLAAKAALGELEYLCDSGVTVTREQAMYLATKGLYYSYTGRFREGQECLYRSLDIQRKQGSRKEIICGLVNLGGAVLSAGDPQGALKLYREARDMLRPREDPPRLQRIVCSSLVLALCEAGQPSEARAVLPMIEELARAIGGWYSRVNVSWLEGTLARVEGDYARSAAIFESVRMEFAGRRHLVWYVEASLDLARVWLAEGQLESLHELACELLKRTEEMGGTPEVWTAVASFAQAVKRRSLTSQLLSSIAIALSSAKIGQRLRE